MLNWNLQILCSCGVVMLDDDDEYEGENDEPVIVTASGDHHVDAFGDDDDGFAEELPHVGIVHGNGDGSCFTDCSTDLINDNSW